MLLLFAAAGIYGAKLLIDHFNGKAREEYERWNQKQEETRRHIARHRAEVERHLVDSKDRINYKYLIELHYNSHKIADEAYALLEDSRKSLDAISETLVSAKKKLGDLYSERKTAQNGKRKAEITEEIKDLHAFRAIVFPEKDKLKGQRDHFLEEVRRLNEQTVRLKEAIRDNTGWRGKQWFNRLEERKRTKRLLYT